MRHINFFAGAQHGVFCVGATKFMLKKFMRFFCPLEEREHAERADDQRKKKGIYKTSGKVALSRMALGDMDQFPRNSKGRGKLGATQTNSVEFLTAHTKGVVQQYTY